MPSIIFQSETVTEYDDGTTDIRFTAEEWEVMAKRPRYYGLCLPCGHSTHHANPAEGCMACFNIMEELAYADTEEEGQAIYDSYPRSPADEEETA